jgi:hypothetical protein
MDHETQQSMKPFEDPTDLAKRLNVSFEIQLQERAQR